MCMYFVCMYVYHICTLSSSPVYILTLLLPPYTLLLLLLYLFTFPSPSYTTTPTPTTPTSTTSTTTPPTSPPPLLPLPLPLLSDAFSGCYSLALVVFEPSSALASVGVAAFYTAGRDAPGGMRVVIQDDKQSIVKEPKEGQANYFPSSAKVTDNLGTATTVTGVYCAIVPDVNGAVTIPNDWTVIPNIAFANCINLITVNLATGSNLKDIGTAAFMHTGLKNISIPDSVTTISNGAFLGCSNLISVAFTSNSTLESIATSTFQESGIVSIDIPNSVNFVGQDTFKSCSSLLSIRCDKQYLLATASVPAVTIVKPTCYPGTYDDSRRCAPCPPGEYSNATNAASCDICPAGTSSPGGVSRCLDCRDGMASEEGMSYCYASKLACGPGTYKDASNSTCLSCPSGTYSNSTNAYECLQCDTNTASGGGSSKCKSCEEGLISKAGSSYCYPEPKPLMCSPGYYLKDDQCHICPAGNYSSTVNATLCTECDRNHTSGSGATVCLACKDGQISEKGMSYCYYPNPPLVCSPGSFIKLIDGEYECSSCPENSWSNEGAKRQTSCYTCPQGTSYSPEWGCRPCPEGFKGVFDDDKRAVCQKCAAGQSTVTPGSTTCIDCPRGMYSSGHGKCQYCWPSTYADLPKSPFCKPCPAGLSAPQAGATSCSVCGN